MHVIDNLSLLKLGVLPAIRFTLEARYIFVRHNTFQIDQYELYVSLPQVTPGVSLLFYTIQCVESKDRSSGQRFVLLYGKTDLPGTMLLTPEYAQDGLLLLLASR